MATSSLCSIPDCGKTAKVKGLCGGHYTRLWRYGDPLCGRTSRGDLPKFYSEVVMKYEDDECLIWPYAAKNGYGVMGHNGKTVLVSRRVCEEVNGPPPTPDHHAAHSCGKGHLGCVTKRHLSWKTPYGNNQDKLVHGTVSRGSRNGTSKLTEKQVIEIMSLKGASALPTIADRFGVSKQTISEIHCGTRWAWLFKAN